MHNFEEVLNERSSIRKYQDRPVEDELVKKIVEAGLKAPTARNAQEIHISVIKGNNPLVKEIEMARREFNAINANEEDKKKIMESKINFYYDAPVIFILSCDSNFRFGPIDAGIAVENMHLMAQSLGLGSLIIGCIRPVFQGEKGKYFRDAMHFPEGAEFAIALSLGYPDTTKVPHVYSEEKSVSYID